MIELISYCVLGGCLLWTLGLVFYLCIESAQDEAKMEEVYRQHAKREWQKMKTHKELIISEGWNG